MKIKRVQDTKPARESTIRDLIGIDLSSDSAAEAADRALSAVQRKLEKTLSVEYTINELVAEATDTMNLANMFAGKCAMYHVSPL
jgi:serine-protein kinase ATM